MDFYLLRFQRNFDEILEKFHKKVTEMEFKIRRTIWFQLKAF